jgi:predicted ATP-dependent serine protease
VLAPSIDNVENSTSDVANNAENISMPDQTVRIQSLSKDDSISNNPEVPLRVPLAIGSRTRKIISSQQLKQIHFETLAFQGRWKMFFGDTSVNFFCVIHGMSGHGKSTFAIQLAKYLADNFGKVIYISGEEGFSKTFKDKFVNNNVDTPFLDVADLRTYEEIIRIVPAESYKYIFIDSLNNMLIDAAKMKLIRARYKASVIIAICQATKAGEMRGSNEIVHDSDIAVKVEDGIASTIKNRFKEKGMTYEVFTEATNPEADTSDDDH